MAKLKQILLYITLVCLFLSGSANNHNSRMHAPTVVTRFERNIWNVAVDLYMGVRQKQEGNFALSPLSLTSVMVMLNAGAGAHTAGEIQHLFKFGSNSAFTIQNHSQVLESLKNQTRDKESKVEFIAGSRIFVNSRNTNIRQDYERAVSSVGKIEAFPFAQPTQVVEKTNEWVKNQTRGKITNVVQPEDFTDDTAAILVNAVYFKAAWKYPFDIDYTRKEDFHASTSESVQVDMMYISQTYFPLADLSQVEANAIFLPYKGNRMSMIIYLPWESSNLSRLEKKLVNLVPAEIRKRAVTQKVKLYLPRFNISSTIDLKPVLTSLGVQQMFIKGVADFSKISSGPPLFVSQLRQKVVIEVNEVGTEAAAATAAYMELYMPVYIHEFKVNRPFIFQIFDEQTSTILFTGRIVNPNPNPNAIQSSNSNPNPNPNFNSNRNGGYTMVTNRRRPGFLKSLWSSTVGFFASAFG